MDVSDRTHNLVAPSILNGHSPSIRSCVGQLLLDCHFALKRPPRLLLSPHRRGWWWVNEGHDSSKGLLGNDSRGRQSLLPGEEVKTCRLVSLSRIYAVGIVLIGKRALLTIVVD